MNRQKAITWALAALLMVLLWDFGHRALFYSPMEMRGEDMHTGAAEMQNEETGEVQAWGSEMEKMNLFSQSRSAGPPRVQRQAPARPVQPPPLESRVVEVRPDMTLSGIIKNQDGEDMAFIGLGNEKPVGLRVGEEIGEARLTTIGKRSVTLEWRGTEIELSLSSQPLFKRR